MSHVLRPARPGDLDALYRLALSTGGGFTNLPPDRDALAARLDRSCKALARAGTGIDDDRFVFMLTDADGQVVGTAQIFSRVGSDHPFFSYRLGAITQHSAEFGFSFRAEFLSLTTDLDGSSEVGGLYLEPGVRAAGLGGLLARSRYLFIRRHRARFADRTLAELRGVIDADRSSPFYDGLAGRFFGMSFCEADEFNAIHGNQFIADLMPKHPIYTALLPESAVAVIGAPHPAGRPAMRMLEAEGFRYEGYLDIFDGGPTMTVATDHIATIAAAREARIIATDLDATAGAPSLIAAGRLEGFRATCGRIAAREGGVAIDAAAAALLDVARGDEITHVAGR